MPDIVKQGVIYPDWKVPNNVKAVMTTRVGGVSAAPFDSLNLGDHVGDDPDAVEQNRALLRAQLDLPSEPIWLSQVHGITTLNHAMAKNGDSADAIVSHEPGQVCAIMTADCLPVLFCNTQGTSVGAAHAGWRGLEAGVLESTIKSMQCEPEDMLVWFGAAIGPTAFEVGDEVRQAFVATDLKAEQAFQSRGNGKWLADIYTLARLRLAKAGISPERIYGGEWCSFSQPEHFFSYRRESHTGRMVSLIWLD